MIIDKHIPDIAKWLIKAGYQQISPEYWIRPDGMRATLMDKPSRRLIFHLANPSWTRHKASDEDYARESQGIEYSHQVTLKLIEKENV